MIIRTLITLLLALSGGGLQASGERTEYYAGLAGVISPLLEYTPRGPVSAERAGTLPYHYRVIYDEQGRLKNIKYFELNRPSNGAYFDTHEVSYEYGQGKRTRSYYGADGAPKAMWRHYYQSTNVQKEVYVTEGNKTTLQMYGLDGERVVVGTGAYSFVAEKGDPRGFYQTQYQQDGTPTVIFDYLPFERSLITKNAAGYLYQILNLEAEGGQVVTHEIAGFAEMRLHFDEYGNEMGWDFRNTNGQLVNRGEGNVDPGYAAWIYDMQWTDRSLGHFTVFTERLETASGVPFCAAGIRCLVSREVTPTNEISRVQVFGPDGKLAMDPDGNYAEIQLSYDAMDRRTEMRFMGTDGALRRTGVAVRTYHYDQSGEAAEIKEFDHTGALIPKKDD